MTAAVASPLSTPPPPVGFEPRAHRWTRVEYHELGRLGVFRGQRVELIGGQIYDMSPIGSFHATAAAKAVRAMFRTFGESAVIRPALPFHAADESEPEPDVAVVAGEPDAYRDRHPTAALLLIEVADTTLRFDQTTLASLYAASGVADYWVINIPERRVEVYRNPHADGSQRFGFAYDRPALAYPGGTVLPLAAPSAPIQVADLLP
jgi:Uma2 family endonuclease